MNNMQCRYLIMREVKVSSRALRKYTRVLCAKHTTNLSKMEELLSRANLLRQCRKTGSCRTRDELISKLMTHIEVNHVMKV